MGSGCGIKRCRVPPRRGREREQDCCDPRVVEGLLHHLVMVVCKVMGFLCKGDNATETVGKSRSTLGVGGGTGPPCVLQQFGQLHLNDQWGQGPNHLVLDGWQNDAVNTATAVHANEPNDH
jgi:hypothetical protein